MRKLPVLALVAATGGRRCTGTDAVDVANHRQQRGPDARQRADLQQLQPAVGELERNGRVPRAQQGHRCRRRIGSVAYGTASTEISAVPSTWSTMRSRPQPAAGPCTASTRATWQGWSARTAIVEITARGKTVPQPNNALINGVLATFEEFPSTPRIDILSPTIATRGQSQPVYEYQIGIDPATGLPLTTKVGTSGVYTNPGKRPDDGREPARRGDRLSVGHRDVPVLLGSRRAGRHALRPVPGQPRGHQRHDHRVQGQLHRSFGWSGQDRRLLPRRGRRMPASRRSSSWPTPRR